MSAVSSQKSAKRQHPSSEPAVRHAVHAAPVPSPDELLASVFLSAHSDADRKVLGRAIVMREARRCDSQFVRVTTAGEVFFHGQLRARAGRRFYLAGNTLEDFATEIARGFSRRKSSSLYR
jgi:hypothetical protein